MIPFGTINLLPHRNGMGWIHYRSFFSRSVEDTDTDIDANLSDDARN